jgi:endonuclease YncB( thermonuclease family)
MVRWPVSSSIRSVPIWLLVGVVAPCVWSLQPSKAEILKATVLSIGDGDTIRVRQSGRAMTVRLACIDAPETAQSPYGQQARRYLQQRLPIGTTVTLNKKTRDRYSRTVAEVISAININLAMVEDGEAFAYRQYLRGCDAKEYLDAEYRASRRRYGVWQVPAGITRPWDFRRQRPNPGNSTGVPQQPVKDNPGSASSGGRYRCKEIGSFTRPQQLLSHGHTYLDRDGDGVACESSAESPRQGRTTPSSARRLNQQASHHHPIFTAYRSLW